MVHRFHSLVFYILSLPCTSSFPLFILKPNRFFCVWKSCLHNYVSDVSFVSCICHRKQKLMLTRKAMNFIPVYPTVICITTTVCYKVTSWLKTEFGVDKYKLVMTGLRWFEFPFLFLQYYFLNISIHALLNVIVIFKRALTFQVCQGLFCLASQP